EDRGTHMHQGQDIGAPCGTSLVSVRNAVVEVRDTQAGGAGNYVVLRNLGTNTRFVYMHLQEPSPRREGDRVGAGQPVGKVGNTGRSFGCHLHFEYWVGQWWTGGKPIDPFPYLRSLLRK
ncbi:MAG: M23 family metallopeptidase, partial [Solirubrobacterales bacterium]